MTREDHVKKAEKLITWILILLSLTAAGISFPVDGLPGVALGLTSIALGYVAFRRLRVEVRR